MSFGKSDTVRKTGEAEEAWPSWLRVTVTLALLFHATAIWAALWGHGSPASPLEVRLAGAFRWYYGLIDQGYSYRYYAPEPPPTPVVTALIRFDDGRTREVRLPDRATWPRMRYQRELALANHLMSEVDQARHETGDAANSLWAQSYARHLGKIHPGARSVTLSVQIHEIPDPRIVADQLRETGKSPDLDDPERFYTVPERIGEFPCDAS